MTTPERLTLSKADARINEIVNEWVREFPGEEMRLFILQHAKDLRADLRQLLVNVAAQNYEDGYKAGLIQGMKDYEQSLPDLGTSKVYLDDDNQYKLLDGD